MNSVLRSAASAALAAVAMAASLSLVELSSADDSQARAGSPTVVQGRGDKAANQVPVVAPDTVRDIRR